MTEVLLAGKGTQAKMRHQTPAKISKENRIPVNPEILRMARERSGFSRRAVAWWSRQLEKCYYASITEQQLTAWEEGLGWPDLEGLETLAEIYDCPLGAFLLPKLLPKWQKAPKWRKILSLVHIAKLLRTILALKIARILDKLRGDGPLDADEEEDK